jgi:hypothetical protein
MSNASNLDLGRGDCVIVQIGDLADVVQAVDQLGVDLATRPDVRRCREAVEVLRRAFAASPALPRPR